MQDRIYLLLDQNYTKKQIADILDIGYSTVRKYSQNRQSTKPRRDYICMDCGETRPDNFYGKMRNRCKTCHNQLGYKIQKEKIYQYAKSRGSIACNICGYDKCFAAMDWHHRDPLEKDPSFQNVRGWNSERLKQELDKCDLLCANCHRELHYNNGGPTLTRTGI